MSVKKQDHLKINKDESYSASLMTVQSELGLFEKKKNTTNKEKQQFLKNTPMAFL